MPKISKSCQKLVHPDSVTGFTGSNHASSTSPAPPDRPRAPPRNPEQKTGRKMARNCPEMAKIRTVKPSRLKKKPSRQFFFDQSAPSFSPCLGLSIALLRLGISALHQSYESFCSRGAVCGWGWVGVGGGGWTPFMLFSSPSQTLPK